MTQPFARYSIFYQNIRGYHWNIKGEKFFELHLKFEELYNDLFLKIDEVAERILTLGHTPTHNYTDYRATSKIKERYIKHETAKRKTIRKIEYQSLHYYKIPKLCYIALSRFLVSNCFLQAYFQSFFGFQTLVTRKLFH